MGGMIVYIEKISKYDIISPFMLDHDRVYCNIFKHVYQ
jgi:hypothetical protein